eukprot:TRINITY_DN3724_c0_g1_i1.p1 TRINITY_DN3724_c0_g1~~TRINITY_DN3724_c0_g1_i1.p1  ORF type:complete len:411 (+),score=112.79 TRINITY_DN3724_c0_g1_i1:73-1233(+)
MADVAMVEAYVLHCCFVRRYCIIDACQRRGDGLALRQLVVHDEGGEVVKDLRRTLRTGDLIGYAEDRRGGEGEAEAEAEDEAEDEAATPRVTRIELAAPPVVLQYKALTCTEWEAMKHSSGYYALKGRTAAPKQPQGKPRKQRAAQGKTSEVSSDARCFSAFLTQTFGYLSEPDASQAAGMGGEGEVRRGLKVLDVAGGKGELAYSLLTGFGPAVVAGVTIVDPRAKAGMLSKPQRRVLNTLGRAEGVPRMGDLYVLRQYFTGEPALGGPALGTEEEAEDAAALHAAADASSVIVGLHPDEATDPIVDYAVAARKPFAVVPCCVFGRQFPHRRIRSPADGDAARPVHTREDLIEYLKQKHPAIKSATVPGLDGANTVVYCERFPTA